MRSNLERDGFCKSPPNCWQRSRRSPEGSKSYRCQPGRRRNLQKNLSSALRLIIFRYSFYPLPQCPASGSRWRTSFRGRRRKGATQGTLWTLSDFVQRDRHVSNTFSTVPRPSIRVKPAPKVGPHAEKVHSAYIKKHNGQRIARDTTRIFCTVRTYAYSHS